MVASFNLVNLSNFLGNATELDCCNASDVASNSSGLPEQSDYEKVVTRFITWFALLVMVVSVFLNGFCLFAFYKEKSLRTVFNCYLICLTMVDFFYAAISMPNFIILNYYRYWPLGQNFCAFYLWADWMFSAAVQNIVMLIGIDRVWELYRPFAYRRHRGPKVTAGMIAGMWFLLITCITPGIVINRLTNTNPLVCEVNLDTPKKQGWAIFVNLICYIVPEIVLIICFGLMAVKIRKQSRILTGRPVQVKFVRSNDGLVAAAIASANQQQQDIVQLQNQVRAAKDRRLFRMLGYLTLSMLVCWMPGNVFWTIYDVDPSVYNFSFSMTVTLMMFMNSVTNPLLYQTGSKEMRRILKGMLPIARFKSLANRDVAALYSAADTPCEQLQSPQQADGRLKCDALVKEPIFPITSQRIHARHDTFSP